MPTWRIEITRDGDGNFVTVIPETAPEWVGDLASDLLYRFRESPSAEQILVTCTGPQDVATPDEEPTHAAPGTPAAGAVVSTGPGTPPPDAVTIPPVSDQLAQRTPINGASGT